MKVVSGDLWTYEADVRVITTNGTIRRDGCCVMGRGCAQQARDSIQGIDKRLGDLIREHGNRAFRLTGDLWTMPVKHNWYERADLELIVASAHQLVEMADKFEVESLVVPRPGCGNGQLSWTEVGPAIQPVLDDRFSVITFG